MPSELHVLVPAEYGNFSYAGPGSPLLALAEHGRDAGYLLNLHLQMVLYSKRWRTEGFINDGVACLLCRPATSLSTARRHAMRLVEAGFIEKVDRGYFVPAAVEWGVVRTGTRDPIPDFIRKRVYDRDGWTCAECPSTDDLELDHIIPWSQYGSDKESNLRTLCSTCNRRKGARV